MESLRALQWAVFVSSSFVSVVLIYRLFNPSARRFFILMWLGVALNHAALYAVAFLFLSNSIPDGASALWSASSRFHVLIVILITQAHRWGIEHHI